MELGKKKVKRDLDIRNLIKAQDLLKTFIKLKIVKREKRKLMRLQRTNIILEPDQDISSQDSEDDFKDFSDAFYLFKEEFDTLVDDESTSISDP